MVQWVLPQDPQACAHPQACTHPHGTQTYPRACRAGRDGGQVRTAAGS